MNDDEKVKAFSSPGLAYPDVVFEQAANGCYLVYDRKESRFQALKDPHLYCRGGLEYVPLPRLPWPTITLPKDYETETQLFDMIKAFFSEHLDVPNELVFDVYAAFVLASWRSEDFTVIPYQFFLGPLASGKTRALECFHRLCYRSIMASSMSAASLFRAVEAWHPTLLLDETEIYNRENMIEVLALLNSGYRKGQYAIRIEKAEQGCPTLGFFDTFGFKVLAGTEELAATLQSRCIITTMSKAVRHVNLFIDEEKAQELRNKLITYRFRNLGKNCEDFDVSKLNGYFNNARVIELFVSLLQVAPTEEIRTRLISCMKQITQSRLDEEQASIEARIFDAVLKCEENVKDGKLSTQAITEAFNQGLSEKEQSTSRFIGRKVTALGFEKCRLSGGPSGFFWDNKHVERLKARYYPTPSISTSLTSLTSQTSLITEENTETNPTASEVSEVIQTSAKLAEVKKTVNSEVSEESEVSEGSLEEVPSLNIREVLEKVAPQLTSVFPEEKLLKQIIGLGFSQEEAQKRVDHFKQKEIISKDDVGNWYFVR
jgi:hypothetical protein